MESELIMMRRLLGMLQANEAQAQASRTAGGYNSGIQGQFINSGQGSQNFGDINYNSGSHSGNSNGSRYYHNNGGNFVHNSGSTYGKGMDPLSPVEVLPPPNRNSYW